jgi:hypothetical protein
MKISAKICRLASSSDENFIENIEHDEHSGFSNENWSHLIRQFLCKSLSSGEKKFKQTSFRKMLVK